MTCVIAGGFTQASFAQQAKLSNLTQFVNPRIGTGGHGHVFLGANVPFGYVQLGPTEPSRGWDWCSGYHHSDSVLIGFGHQHLSGTGIGDLGDVAFLPVTDASQKEILFSHANENVRPGYYAVKLQQPNVWVELTATQRAGFQRYTFGADAQQAQLVLDLKQGIGWDAAKDYNVYIVAPAPTNDHEYMAKVQTWVEEYLSTPAYNHIIFCNQKNLLYGDYFIDPSPCDGFMGTAIEYGSDEFKTFEEIITFFERLGGQ